MDYQSILYAVEDGVLAITLNRPDKLNAVNDAMLHELIDAFRQAKRDNSVRCVVLTGAGRGFCPGADLDSVQERAENGGSFDYGEHLRTTFNPLITLITELPKPVIGAVNGVAAGAGMSIALATDYRIAAESAAFLQAFVKIGLVPDSGSTWMLPRLVGLTRAIDLMLTGRKIDAQTALDWGLLNQVVADDLLMSVADQMARSFAAGPTRAIGYIKQAIRFSAKSTLVEALEYEADMQDLAGRTADHQEGISAFLEKRTPKFAGE